MKKLLPLLCLLLIISGCKSKSKTTSKTPKAETKFVMVDLAEHGKRGQIGRPRLAFGLGGPGLLRYNRVEGISVGARGQVVADAVDARQEAVTAVDPLAALKLLIGVHDQSDTGEAGGAECAEVVAEAIRSASAAKVRPRAVLYLHLTPQTLAGRGVARAEEIGALTRARLVEVLGHHQISLRPVIDLNQAMAADCYEVPAAIDERLQLSKPADVFPFASSLSRTLDRDHTVAYQEHGPPGQTSEPNLGKLSRHHHRIKTHAGWRVVQQDNRFTWTTPHGRVYLTDRLGTHRVGARTPRPQVVWADLEWEGAA